MSNEIDRDREIDNDSDRDNDNEIDVRSIVRSVVGEHGHAATAGEYDRGHALPLFLACAQPAQVDRRRPTGSYMLE